MHMLRCLPTVWTFDVSGVALVRTAWLRIIVGQVSEQLMLSILWNLNVMVMIRCFHSGFIASVWISRYHGLRSFDIASSNSNFEAVVARCCMHGDSSRQNICMTCMNYFVLLQMISVYKWQRTSCCKPMIFPRYACLQFVCVMPGRDT